jgi:protein-S-isoprenylcysteine O-methyltransferase Ste14
MNQTFFHSTFVIVFITIFGIRAVYHRKAQKAMGKAEYKEGKWHVAWRVGFDVPFMFLFFAYMVNPNLLSWTQFPLPAWAQWLGVMLGVASVPLMWWVQWALGANFSTVLHVRENHTLVTHGPYRWVRHPMYTALYLLEIAALLLTANWFIGGLPLVVLTIIVGSRVANEEVTMVEKFGDAYRTYMQHTGRFFPKLIG